MSNQSQNIIRFFVLLGAVTDGLFIGYERQLLADSGEYFPAKVFVSALIGASSYFLAFVLCSGRRFFSLPGWSLVSVVGSVIWFFKFARH